MLDQEPRLLNVSFAEKEEEATIRERPLFESGAY